MSELASKDVMLRVRLTVAEVAKLRGLADATESNMSEVIRYLLANAIVVVRPISVVQSVPMEQREVTPEMMQERIAA